VDEPAASVGDALMGDAGGSDERAVAVMAGATSGALGASRRHAARSEQVVRRNARQVLMNRLGVGNA
jgi:hypothetical protein